MSSICSNSEMATLFVGNLHLDATEAELVEMFTTFGPVSSVSIHTETVLRRSHRYAYVDFRNEIDAKCAMERFCLAASTSVSTRVTSYKPDAGKIFLSNLDNRMESIDLYDAFAEFGNILSCKVAKNLLGNSIGCAFVRFETEVAANACIELCHEKKLFDEEIKVEKFDVRNEDELDEKTKLVMQFKMAIRNALFKSNEDSEQPKTAGEVELKGEGSFVEKSNQFEKNEEKLDEKIKAIKEFKMTVYKAVDESVEVCEQPETDCDNEVMQITDDIASMNQVSDLELQHRESAYYQAAVQSQFKTINSIKAEENKIQTQQEQMAILTYRIQSQVGRMFPDLASQLTARLMENDISPLLSIMEDKEAFKQEINEMLLEIDFSSLFN